MLSKLLYHKEYVQVGFAFQSYRCAMWKKQKNAFFFCSYVFYGSFGYSSKYKYVTSCLGKLFDHLVILEDWNHWHQDKITIKYIWCFRLYRVHSFPLSLSHSLTLSLYPFLTASCKTCPASPHCPRSSKAPHQGKEEQSGEREEEREYTVCRGRGRSLACQL